MKNDFESGAAKAKDVMSDAGAAVAETAKEGTTKMSKLFHMALSALPATSERLFELMLDRVGLARRSSGLGGVALFMGGFMAGSVATAFSTPISGPELRKRTLKMLNALAGEAEAKVSELAKDAVDLEKSVVKRVQVATGDHAGTDHAGTARAAGTATNNGH